MTTRRRALPARSPRRSRSTSSTVIFHRNLVFGAAAPRRAALSLSLSLSLCLSRSLARSLPLSLSPSLRPASRPRCLVFPYAAADPEGDDQAPHALASQLTGPCEHAQPSRTTSTTRTSSRAGWREDLRKARGVREVMREIMREKCERNRGAEPQHAARSTQQHQQRLGWAGSSM